MRVRAKNSQGYGISQMSTQLYEGCTWLVTFISVYDIGDQHRRPTSSLSTSYSYKLSIDGSNVSDVDRSSCSIGGEPLPKLQRSKRFSRRFLGPMSVKISWAVTVDGAVTLTQRQCSIIYIEAVSMFSLYWQGTPLRVKSITK